MPDIKKRNQILDALQHLLESKEIQEITVSEIAKTAGIGKGSIYYYFPSKEAILEALIQRNYEQPLRTAKNLAAQSNISPFTRMAMIFQACRNSSSELLRHRSSPANLRTHEGTLIHQKYLEHLVRELKPTLTQIIEQGIKAGEIHFDRPAALAEIVLIVLAVKLDNFFIPSSDEEIEETIQGLISLLEKGTGTPEGSFNYLTSPL